MFNIDLLRAYYKGKGLKIALIDTGVTKSFVNCHENIVCYKYSSIDDSIKKDNKNEVVSFHGDDCAWQIHNVAPKTTLISINVLDDSGEITEEAVLCAMRFALDDECDIINLSIGFIFYSEKIDKICEIAFNSNVFVLAAASHGTSVLYPSSFGNKTICVFEENNTSNRFGESIKLVKKNKYIVNIPPIVISKKICVERKDETTIVSGSSIACAYFSAILSLFLESRPFIDIVSFHHSIYGESTANTQKHSNCKPNLDLQLHDECIITFLGDVNNYENIFDKIDKRVCGVYDTRLDIISYLRNSTNKKHHLYVVNSIILPRSQFYKKPIWCSDIIYVGNFNGVDSYQGQIFEHDSIIRNINTPTIFIVGIGVECGKFGVLCELYKGQRQKGTKDYYTTYNPIGAFCNNMEYLRYPEKQTFSDIVYSVNKHIRDIEDTHDVDSFVIDIGGGIFPLSRINTNDFGMLFHAYMNAIPADYIVICTNNAFDPLVLKKYLSYIKIMSDANISIVVSNFNYDPFSIENTSKTLSHTEDIFITKNGIERYRNALQEEIVFSFQDVKEGKLLSDIYTKLS